jgi:nucleoside-diphosphate-sugar epimerase
MQMQNVLITGAGGYIGSILTAALLEAGNHIVAVDRFFFGENVFLSLAADQKLQVKRADIRDLTPRDFEGVDAVIDLAALSNDPSGDIDPKLTEAINRDGRLHVANCARAAGVRRYILSSSCSVYGTGGTHEQTETSPTNPLTTYARSMLDAESKTREIESSTFCWSAVRLATAFGLSQRMRFDLAVNSMTLSAVQKGRITVLGGGRQWRPLIHVRDIARAFQSLLEAPTEVVSGQIYNVGLANYSVIGLAYVVREALPFAVQIDVAPDDPDRRNYQVSFQKIATALGFKADVTVPDAVHEIYEALKSGRLEQTAKTSTVGWYRSILEADKIIREVRLNGRLL